MTSSPVVAARPATATGGTGVPPEALGWTRGDTVRALVAAGIGVAVLGLALRLGAVGGDGLGGRGAPFTLLAGAGLGVVFQRGRFCFYCIFRDAFVERDTRGVYAVLAALVVGTLGYALVFSIRLPDPRAGQLPADAHIAPVGPALVAAGLVFGLGVVLSHGCIAGHLYRIGEGSLRSIPALLGALVGFGLGFLSWNPLFRSTISDAPAPWLPAGGGYGVAVLLQLGVLVAVGVALLRWNRPLAARPERVVDASELRRRVFFERWPALVSGSIVGAIGVLALLRDRPLGVTSQLSSLTRTVLDDRELLPWTLLGLDQRLGGCVAVVVETITTNGWLILGIVAGSFAAALPGRRFALEAVSAKGVAASLLGGVALGWGSIVGLGCTIGVLLSGTQALALSGWVFAASVVAAMGIGFRLGLHRT